MQSGWNPKWKHNNASKSEFAYSLDDDLITATQKK